MGNFPKQTKLSLISWGFWEMLPPPEGNHESVPENTALYGKEIGKWQLFSLDVSLVYLTFK